MSARDVEYDLCFSMKCESSQQKIWVLPTSHFSEGTFSSTTLLVIYWDSFSCLSWCYCNWHEEPCHIMNNEVLYPQCLKPLMHLERCGPITYNLTMTILCIFLFQELTLLQHENVVALLDCKVSIDHDLLSL